MIVAAIRAKRPVIAPHRGRKTGGDGFLSEREMTRALDEILQEQIVRALFEHAQTVLQFVHRDARLARNRRINERLAHLGWPP